MSIAVAKIILILSYVAMVVLGTYFWLGFYPAMAAFGAVGIYSASKN